MRVTILQTPQELPVTTVTLQLDASDLTRLNLMHCMKCGYRMIQYQGNIIRVIPGGLPQNIMELSPKLIVQCKGCDTRYLLNNIV